MAETISPTIEDYLGLIYLMQREGQTVIGARLAERLGVSRPTVTVTLQRMERDGLISVNDRKEVVLTQAGQEAAQDLLRRHMLAEWLLHQVIGVPWHEVHAEADRLEHSFSEQTVARLQTLFEERETCPHGNPMPGTTPAPAIPLDQLTEGAHGVVVRIVEAAESRHDLMSFIEENQLMPGTRLYVRSCLPCNETVTVEIAGRQVVLGLNVAHMIHVRPEEKSSGNCSGQG